MCVRRCRNFWVLIGTASTWFLLDIAFYSQNLFLPNILEGIGYNPKINLPASKCVKTKTCPHYNLPVSPPLCACRVSCSNAAVCSRQLGQFRQVPCC